MIEIFPKTRSDEFFEALYGDPDEGAYNISLHFKDTEKEKLFFEFHLSKRPDKCLRCNLTYGLPQVFSKHPVIDVKGVVEKLQQELNGKVNCVSWSLGETQEISSDLHVIPLTVLTEIR